MELPLRAVMVGDVVENNQTVVWRLYVGSYFNPSSVRLILDDGVEFEGDGNVLIHVEELSFTPGLDKIFEVS